MPKTRKSTRKPRPRFTRIADVRRQPGGLVIDVHKPKTVFDQRRKKQEPPVLRGHYHRRMGTEGSPETVYTKDTRGIDLKGILYPKKRPRKKR